MGRAQRQARRGGAASPERVRSASRASAEPWSRVPGLASRAHDLANERLRLTRAPATVPDPTGPNAELVVADSHQAPQAFAAGEAGAQAAVLVCKSSARASRAGRKAGSRRWGKLLIRLAREPPRTPRAGSAFTLPSILRYLLRLLLLHHPPIRTPADVSESPPRHAAAVIAPARPQAGRDRTGSLLRSVAGSLGE